MRAIFTGVLTLKLALAHDWLNQMGGAENVLERLVEMFPALATAVGGLLAKAMFDRSQSKRKAAKEGSRQSA